MRKRVAILCSNDAHHEYLVSLLQSKFNVVAVVSEPAASQRRRLLKIKKYEDYAYSLYHHFRRTVLGLDRYRHRYFADKIQVQPPSSCRSLTVEWINDPAVVKLLSEVAPDLTVIICTSILGKEVLQAAGEIVINIHGGFLPYYRGNHCFFFALYQGEFDKIGSSIHFVDRGIDTGNIIEVVIPPIRSDDNAEKLYCRAEKLAIHRLAYLLERYEQGHPFPRQPQALRGPLYRTRDRKPHHDILFWLRRISGRLVIPASANQEFITPAQVEMKRDAQST